MTEEGPRCRDCADNDGVCEHSGLPCDPRLKASFQALRERVAKLEAERDEARNDAWIKTIDTENDRAAHMWMARATKAEAALVKAHAFIMREYACAKSQALDGEAVSVEARPILAVIHAAILGREAVSNVATIERPSSPQAEITVLERLQRWQRTLGSPMGNGRANPDNDLWYLLHDAEEVIEGLRTYARHLERGSAFGFGSEVSHE